MGLITLKLSFQGEFSSSLLWFGVHVLSVPIRGTGTGGAEGAAAPPVFFCGQL